MRMSDTVAPDCRVSLGNIASTVGYSSKIGLYCLNTLETSTNWERMELIAGPTGGNLIWAAGGTGVMRNLTIYNTMTFGPTGLVSILNTTDATPTGAAPSLSTAGGASVAKSVRIGGSYSAAGQPAFSACHLTTTTIPTGVETNLSYNTIIVDQRNSWAAPTFTAPEAGLYVINLVWGFNQLQLATDMLVRIRVTTLATATTRVHLITRCNPTAMSGTGEVAGSGSIMTLLATGDTVSTTVIATGGLGDFVEMGSAQVTRNSLSIYKIA